MSSLIPTTAINLPQVISALEKGQYSVDLHCNASNERTSWCDDKEIIDATLAAVKKLLVPPVKTKKKHYLGEIVHTSGEFETHVSVRFITGGSPTRYLAKVAKNWYADFVETTDKGHLFFSGEVIVCEGSSQVISKDVYDAISIVVPGY